MNSFQRISVAAAKSLLDGRPAQVVDIRDQHSFAQGHIPSAVHIDNDSAQTFIDSADRAAPLLVCCYHGFSSQNAAQFFAEQGFAEVYSLDGGFEAWRGAFPEN
jgi:thiosulfate sulfurtransferase